MPIQTTLSEESKSFLNQIDTNPKTLVGQVKQILKDENSYEKAKTRIEELIKNPFIQYRRKTTREAQQGGLQATEMITALIKQKNAFLESIVPAKTYDNNATFLHKIKSQKVTREYITETDRSDVKVKHEDLLAIFKIQESGIFSEILQGTDCCLEVRIQGSQKYPLSYILEAVYENEISQDKKASLMALVRKSKASDFEYNLEDDQYQAVLKAGFSDALNSMNGYGSFALDYIVPEIDDAKFMQTAVKNLIESNTFAKPNRIKILQKLIDINPDSLIPILGGICTVENLSLIKSSLKDTSHAQRINEISMSLLESVPLTSLEGFKHQFEIIKKNISAETIASFIDKKLDLVSTPKIKEILDFLTKEPDVLNHLKPIFTDSFGILRLEKNEADIYNRLEKIKHFHELIPQEPVPDVDILQETSVYVAQKLDQDPIGCLNRIEAIKELTGSLGEAAHNELNVKLENYIKNKVTILPVEDLDPNGLNNFYLRFDERIDVISKTAALLPGGLIREDAQDALNAKLADFITRSSDVADIKNFDRNIEVISKATALLPSGLSAAAQNALNAKLTAFIGAFDITLPAESATKEQIAEHYQKIERNIEVISKAAALLTGGLSEAAQAALNAKLTAFIGTVDITLPAESATKEQIAEHYQQIERNIEVISKAAALLPGGLIREDAQDALNAKLTAFIGAFDITLPAESATKEQIAEHYQKIERNIEVISKTAALLPGGLSEAAQAALNNKICDTVKATPVVTKTKRLGMTTLANEKEFNKARQLIRNLSKHVVLAPDTEEAFETKLKAPGNISQKFFYEPFKLLVSQIKRISVKNLTLQIQRREVNSLASAQDLLYVDIKNTFSHWEISRKDLVAKLMGDKGIGPQDQKNFKEILTEEYINKALAIAGDELDLKYFQARVCLIAGDEKAFGLLSELNKINPNNPKILTDLGQCNEHGIGCEKNPVQAFKYFKQAADQTHAPALFALGRCYEDGIGTENDQPNKETALGYYQQAATQNFALAQHELGRCNQYGIGVEKNEGEAFRHYQQAAKQGLAEAQYELGECYLEGFGCQKDKSKAFEYSRLAAKQGLAEAQYLCGVLSKNTFVRDQYIKAAADQGLKEAQFSYGEIEERMAKTFKTGGGTDHLIKKKQEEALKYYQLAAKQDHKKAQYQLGVCYANGIGCAKNPTEALNTYAKLYQDIKSDESLRPLKKDTKKQIKSVFTESRGKKDLLESLDSNTKEVLKHVIKSKLSTVISALRQTDAQKANPQNDPPQIPRENSKKPNSIDKNLEKTKQIFLEQAKAHKYNITEEQLNEFIKIAIKFDSTHDQDAWKEASKDLAETFQKFATYKAFSEAYEHLSSNRFSEIQEKQTPETKDLQPSKNESVLKIYINRTKEIFLEQAKAHKYNITEQELNEFIKIAIKFDSTHDQDAWKEASKDLAETFQKFATYKAFSEAYEHLSSNRFSELQTINIEQILKSEAPQHSR